MSRAGRQAGRLSRRFFFLVGLATVGCGWEAADSDVEARREERAASSGTFEQPLETGELPPFPEGAVVGVMERVEAGRVVATRVLSAGPEVPENLGELLSTGEADGQGYIYYDVTGAYSEDGRTVTQYQYVRRTRSRPVPAEAAATRRAGGVPAPQPADPPPKLAPEVVEKLDHDDPNVRVEIYIALERRFSTSLRAEAQLGAQRGLLTLIDAERQVAERRTRIAARKEEATALQASVIERLRELGASEIGGYWTSNAVSATIALGAIRSLAEHPDVSHVEFPDEGYDLGEDEWDGDDMKASGGLNGGVYHDNGFHGQAYADNPGGRHMKIAVIGGAFDIDHPAFLDCAGCASRVVKAINCQVSPCCEIGVGGCPTPAPQVHATRTAGLATGSIRQNQIPGYTDQEELERTGMVEEAEIQLIAIDLDTNDAKRAIEWAMENDADVLVSSTGFPDAKECDGVVGSGLNFTVHQAVLDGLVVFQAAGNINDGTCTVQGLAESPSAFVVGGAMGNAEGACSQCTKSNWSTCNIGTYSSRGGMNITVNGVPRNNALSMIAGIGPGAPSYFLNTSGGIDYICSKGATSWAAPQIGGLAVMVKDWFMDQGHTIIDFEGRLFVVMQAMTDRANGASSYTTAGFDPRWGGCYRSR